MCPPWNRHFPENILHIILVYIINIFIKYNIDILTVVRGFLNGSAGKEPTFQYRRCKRLGLNPWVGKISWRRKWQLTPVFLPGEFHGQRSLAGYNPAVTRVRHYWVPMHTQHLQRPLEVVTILPILWAKKLRWQDELTGPKPSCSEE